MSYEANLHDAASDTYAAFAANDVELVFGRWDPDGEIGSWQSVGVVISELKRNTYGLIIAANNCREPATGPIVSSIIDDFFVYESSEFRSVVFLTLFGPIHMVGSQGLRMTLRFRIALEFHECMRFLAEAKSQLTCLRDRLSEKLGLVFDHHFSTHNNLPQVNDDTSTSLSPPERHLVDPTSPAQSEALAPSSPTRSARSTL